MCCSTKVVQREKMVPCSRFMHDSVAVRLVKAGNVTGINRTAYLANTYK